MRRRVVIAVMGTLAVLAATAVHLFPDPTYGAYAWVRHWTEVALCLCTPTSLPPSGAVRLTPPFVLTKSTLPELYQDHDGLIILQSWSGSGLGSYIAPPEGIPRFEDCYRGNVGPRLQEAIADFELQNSQQWYFGQRARPPRATRSYSGFSVIGFDRTRTLALGYAYDSYYLLDKVAGHWRQPDRIGCLGSL